MDHEYEAVLGDLKSIYNVLPDVTTLGDDLKNWEGVGKAVKDFLISNRQDLFMHYDRNCYAITKNEPLYLKNS